MVLIDHEDKMTGLTIIFEGTPIAAKVENLNNIPLNARLAGIKNSLVLQD